MSSLQSSFENEGFNLHSAGIPSPDATLMAQSAGDYIDMPPISDSFAASLVENLPGVSNMAMGGMSVGPYVMRSRSTIEHRSVSRNSHSPTMSDSGISMEAGSTGSNSSAPFVNIAALAKLGSVGYSNQGKRFFRRPLFLNNKCLS